MNQMPNMPIDVSQVRIPRLPRGAATAGAALIVAAVVAFGALYQVQPEEVGVVLRFGRYVRATDPGLRAKIPFAETVLKVPVQRQLKQEFGFRTLEAGIRTEYVAFDRDATEESMMLTGDLNVAVVEWIVQYRVADPYLYLFKVRNPRGHLPRHERGDHARGGRRPDGHRSAHDRAPGDRVPGPRAAAGSGQPVRDGHHHRPGGAAGRQPPDPVKPSWDEVNQAQQQRDRMINEARAEYNRVIPRARGEAQQTVLQAEGYALDRVNRSEGEATRFEAVQAAYRLAPNVTRRRLYLETMQRILPRVGRKLYVDQDVTGVLPLLSLDGAAPRRATNATPAGAGGGQ